MNSVSMLRVLTFLEGVSYLVLLCIAMPLKYLGGMPIAVSLAGGLHGILFLAFIVTLYQAQQEQRWAPSRAFLLFAGALIPGNLLWLDRRIRMWTHNKGVEQ